MEATYRKRRGAAPSLIAPSTRILAVNTVVFIATQDPVTATLICLPGLILKYDFLQTQCCCQAVGGMTEADTQTQTDNHRRKYQPLAAHYPRHQRPMKSTRH